jgi:primosomal protein N' (replication factor Y)
MLRAAWHHAKVLLGSATPSLESRARAQQGVYDFVMMQERANAAAEIPQVQLIDFKANVSDVSQNFTPQLLNKIQEKLDRKEQIVLMLNRRGYSSFVMCRDCGYVVECPNCDVSLTFHRSTHSLNCHYCGHMEPQPSQCPNCQSANIRDYGSGTEKVEQELGEIFPDARVLRMDVDTTSRKGAHEKILDAFEAGKADILLGTQMIAKGLDFPNVTLVGVINADTGLNLPDFRASERTFQLLTQVAGRAGRADKAGEVIIQTYNPDHYALQFAQHHDYEGFYQMEMGYRQKMAYPPYYYTVQVVVSHSDEQQVLKASYEILADVQKHLSQQAVILGPIAKGVARTHNQYHYQLLIKYKQEPGLAPALNDILAKAQGPGNRHLKIAIDYEPQNFV